MISTIFSLALTCLATVTTAVPTELATTGGNSTVVPVSSIKPAYTVPTLAELERHKLVISSEENSTSLAKRDEETCLHGTGYAAAAVIWKYYAHNWCQSLKEGGTGVNSWQAHVDLRDLEQTPFVLNYAFYFRSGGWVINRWECMKGFDQVIDDAVSSFDCPGNSGYRTGDGMGAWAGGTNDKGIPGPRVGYYLWITTTPPSNSWDGPDPSPRSAALSRTGWTAFASSDAGYEAGKVLDNDPTTYWHSSSSSSLPQTIDIDMGSIHENVNGLSYLPRQDGLLVNPDGRIGQYEIYLSTNGNNWGTAVASSTWVNDALEKSATFTEQRARYVRLQAISEVGGNHVGFVAAAEINVYAAKPKQWPWS